MAKIVTIHLLVAADETTAIEDGLNEALREITHPMGSGIATGSFILDYAFGNLDVPVKEGIADAIVKGQYEEGSAFTQGQDLYLLLMQGDVEPDLWGPFASENDRLYAARQAREQSDEDGLYKIDTSHGAIVTVTPFTGVELMSETDPVIAHIVERLKGGEHNVICRPAVGALRYFTVFYEGDEVVVSVDMLQKIEELLDDEMVELQEETADVLMPRAAAARRHGMSDWRYEVHNGDTALGFVAWQSEKLSNYARYAMGSTPL